MDNETERLRERVIRWQQLTIEQLTGTINILLSFSLAALALQSTLLWHDGARWIRSIFLSAFLATFLSAALGVCAQLNRLRDFRITATIVRQLQNPSISDSTESLRHKSKDLGEWTWKLVCGQAALFLASIILTTIGLLAITPGFGNPLFDTCAKEISRSHNKPRNLFISDTKFDSPHVLRFAIHQPSDKYYLCNRNEAGDVTARAINREEWLKTFDSLSLHDLQRLCISRIRSVWGAYVPTTLPTENVLSEFSMNSVGTASLTLNIGHNSLGSGIYRCLITPWGGVDMEMLKTD